MAVQPIPERYRSVTPFLIAEGAAELIDFLKQAFGAKEFYRAARSDGSIEHAELKVGDSTVMLAEAVAQDKPMPCCFYLYVRETDEVYRRAVQAGAVSLAEPADQFWGDRCARVKDPSGNVWHIAMHTEDIAPDEMARRARSASAPANG